MLVAIPGLVIALLLFRILKDPPHLTRASTAPRRHIPWSHLFKSRNVILAAAGLVCAMSCVFVMVPNYLTDHMKLSGPTMGFVMSAMGWGGFLGEFGLAGISDFIGRKRATIIAFIGAAISTWEFFHVSAGIPMLFLWLGIVSFFGLGLTSILTGPVATEAVPPALTSSAIVMVSGIGEIFGGGIAPVVAGFVAQRFDIEHIFWIPMVGLSIGIVVSLGLLETAPRFIARDVLVNQEMQPAD
jgi:predicted MFS family arabinose efflux permease